MLPKHHDDARLCAELVYLIDDAHDVACLVALDALRTGLGRPRR
jgi:hypothetical protein